MELVYLTIALIVLFMFILHILDSIRVNSESTEVLIKLQKEFDEYKESHPKEMVVIDLELEDTALARLTEMSEVADIPIDDIVAAALVNKLLEEKGLAL